MKFPDVLVNDLRRMAKEILEEEADKNPMARKVHESFKIFKKQAGIWGLVSERAYFKSISDEYSLNA